MDRHPMNILVSQFPLNTLGATQFQALNMNKLLWVRRRQTAAEAWYVFMDSILMVMKFKLDKLCKEMPREKNLGRLCN